MHIDSTTKLRVNIHNAYKGFSKLDTPEIRERAGLVEIPDPARGNDEIEYTQEINEAPYIIITPKSPEQLDAQNIAKTNAQSLAYLAETDWMVTRFAEGGAALSVEVKAKRQAARDAVVHVPSVMP